MTTTTPHNTVRITGNSRLSVEQLENRNAPSNWNETLAPISAASVASTSWMVDIDTPTMPAVYIEPTTAESYSPPANKAPKVTDFWVTMYLGWLTLGGTCWDEQPDNCTAMFESTNKTIEGQTATVDSEGKFAPVYYVGAGSAGWVQVKIKDAQGLESPWVADLWA
jgi:hypothetical protein